MKKAIAATITIFLLGCTTMNDSYNHPTFGGFELEDTDWLASSSTVPFLGYAIDVMLEGTEEKPTDKALKAYETISSNWNETLEKIKEQAFQYYEPYADAFPSVPKLDSAEKLWGTEKVLFINIRSEDEYEVTMRFDWQEEEDDHQITFYIEDGVCETHTVDG